MRSLLLLFLVFGLAFPAFAAKRVSVEELQQLLAAAHGKRDGQIAGSLSQLELTQRLNSVTLSRWLSQLPGHKSRDALTALADMSAFLDLPSAEIPVKAAPTIEEQRRMIDLSIHYIHKTIRELPNLFATRVTTSFQDIQARPGETQPRAAGYEPLYLAGRYSRSVVYREGGGQPGSAAVKHQKAPTGLVTSGEFGLLGTVLQDALQSSLSWSRWEQGAAGIVAVYRYAVPANQSHYEVGSSWLQGADKDRLVIQQFSAYAGEIAIDPANGTILRLVMKAATRPNDPMIKANILVEYGPVVIDGRTYICPVRSIALSVAAQLDISSQADEPTLLQTSLNDVVFEQYHLFHADVRILGGYSVSPAATPDAR
jgi:hypothetical protein